MTAQRRPVVRWLVGATLVAMAQGPAIAQTTAPAPGPATAPANGNSVAITPAPPPPSPDPGDVLGSPSQLNDFTLKGTVARPGGTVTPPPRPTPGSTTAPAGTTGAAPGTATAPSAARPATTSDGNGRAPPPIGAPPAMTITPAPDPTTAVPVAAEPLPAPLEPPSPTAAAGRGWGTWWLLVAGLAAAAAAAATWWRRRARDPIDDDDGLGSMLVVDGAVMAGAGSLPPAPAPAPTPPAAPAGMVVSKAFARPPSSSDTVPAARANTVPAARAETVPAARAEAGGMAGMIVSTRLSPRLETAMVPSAMRVEAERAVLQFDLTLSNIGSAPARDVLVEALMINAGPAQDAQLAEFFNRPAAAGERLEAVMPLASMAMSSQIELPRGAFQPLLLQGRSLLVPMIAFNVHYRGPGGAQVASSSYLVGRGTAQSVKLAPFRLDLVPRSWRQLSARPHSRGIER